MISSFKTKPSASFTKKHQERNGHNLFPHSVFCFKIPRYMGDGRVRLRPLRISDIPFMHSELRDKDILKADGLTKLMTGSWFHLWWWLKKTFIFRYAIEADSGLVGFMGLHHLLPGRSAELTLLIADERDRRLGHGSRAFTLLAQNLERYSSVKKLIVRVKPDNEAARSFWSKMGLEIHCDENGMQVMSVGLTSRD